MENPQMKALWIFFIYLFENKLYLYPKNNTVIKKILFVAFTAIGLLTYAQGIKFEENKLSEILAKAKKENKLVFIDSYTSWCAPCKIMAKKIFPLQSVGDYYNSNFINAKFNMEKGEGIAIAKKYNVKVYPTYLFLDGDGKEIHRTMSSMDEQEFIQLGKDALDPSKQITTLKRRFDAGEKDPELLKSLIQLTNDDDAYNPKVFKRYFTVKPEIDKEDAMMLFTSINGTDDSRYQLLQENKSKIIQLISQENFDEYNKFVILKGIRKKAYEKLKKLDEKVFLAEAQKFFGKEEAEKILFNEKISESLENKNYAAYEKMVLDKYKDNYSNEEPLELAYVAENFLNHIKTRSSLEKALLWSSDAAKRNPHSMTFFTLAGLYNKLGDKTNAKIYAEKALEEAKKAKYQSEDLNADIQKLLDSLK